MIRRNSFISVRLPLALFVATLVACSSTDEHGSNGPTLADIDISQKRQRLKSDKDKQPELAKKSQDEVRRAYRTYVEGAASNDTSRQQALTRLAQLELELSTSISDEQRNASSDVNDDPAVQQSIQRTITLLETTLRDYPKAKNNDKVLYQLAQAYDRAGEYQKSIDTLKYLAKNYRRSLHYPEAQFRVGEAAFVRGDYITAEDAYTEVVLTPGSEKFYEKALFKRGWTRYKQQFFLEAIDDYVNAIEFHEFEVYERLTDSDKSQFNEYFRALGLAFSYALSQTTIKDYFASRANFPYIYNTYATVSDIYLKQERFSDAATVLEEYTRSNPTSNKTAEAEQRVIAAWRQGGFTTRLYAAIETYYLRYQPKSAYWQSVNDEAIYKTTQEALRTYLTQVSSYFHERYQKQRKNDDFRQAKNWYERYLNHFSAYANKDNTYALFAELLLDAGDKAGALNYFALAAFDGNIILDKSAAYSSIVLTSDLMDNTSNAQERAQWLDKHLAYAQRFIELYPQDDRTEAISTNASQRAFNDKRYETTIAIANFIPDSASAATHFTVDKLKARAYLAQEQYADAESVYLELLESRLTKRRTAQEIRNSLALAIYRQGELAQKSGQTDIALSHFTRIVRTAPESTLAATGLYDAIALSMQKNLWNQSIGLINEFQARYPKHEHNKEISKKLSVAYLNSDQKGKAAQEFEKIAKFENNVEVKMAAQWQAAELYKNKNNIPDAIRAYREYAHTYKKPFAQNMEAMYILSDLYKQQGDTQKRYFWQTRIRLEDQKATKREKTDRTTYIASTTTLALARQKQLEYSTRKLVEPIAKNLKIKKTAMQDAVKLYGKASSYGIQEITTESTFAIGEIYQTFSQSLLQSERPRNLSADELEQYEILLEDQAFPFEEKAIEFYETNMARSRDGTYDDWLARSLQQLQQLFPVRYQRKGKLDAYRG